MTQNPQLPVDPDIGRYPVRQLRNVHSIGLVILGGTAGTLLRLELSELFPQFAGIIEGVLISNIAGALFLGFLLEKLLRRGPETVRGKSTRLLLGTGFAGGFTSYSALALNAAQLLQTEHPWVGVGYGLGTVLLGAAATVTGIALGVRRTRTKSRKSGEGQL